MKAGGKRWRGLKVWVGRIGITRCHFTASNCEIYDIVRIDIKILLVKVFVQELFS